MNPDTQIHNLEHSLIARARELVREHLDKAESERNRIRTEVAQRLRLAEEREILAAKSEAERVFRRRVQAAEIRFQGDLDRLRWTLVQSVVSEVDQRLARLADDEAAYLPFLKGQLGVAAQSIAGETLIAELNARDRDRYSSRWATLAQGAVPGRAITLAASTHNRRGGVIVFTADRLVRIDNTFEGRLDRLGNAIHAAILERLFAAVPHMGSLFHG